MPIFDQGYQHWNGPLAGHAGRWLAVARHGVRAVLKGRIVRLLLFVAWVPALALVAFLCLWGLLEQQAESVLTFLSRMLPAEMIAQPRDFRTAVWTVAYSFFFKAELIAALFLVLIVGPNLVSRDLRFNALPLYFSRPVRRIDYFLGKLAVIGFFLAATVIVPAAGAYLLGVGFSLDLGVVRDTHRLLWGGTLYGLIVTVSAGTLMLALSSLSRRSIYVGLAWAGFCFLTLMVSGILLVIRIETQRHQIVEEGMAQWMQDHRPPAGVKMWGSMPAIRFVTPRDGRGPGKLAPQRDEAAHPASFTPAEQEAAQQWYDDWTTARRRLRDQAEATRHEEGRTDWRPVISYATNLDRLGDWLLDTDSAWLVLGRAFERPRAALGPMANLQAGGRLPRELTGPANDRLLADRMAWQFPWPWSAGVLGGLWLLSVFVLTSRVKSLDRLK
jgi:ABC-type transport system involved in multi-copper enzyme maturation permease subunit